MSPSDAKYDLSVAEREDHTEISPLAGLKSFIIDTEALIKDDSIHFIEEGFSDAFAIGFSGYAAFNSAVNQSLEPLADDIGNIGSAFCAFLLMYGLYDQRKEKLQEYVQALKLFIEYEDDAEEHDHEKAVEILKEKMGQAGFRYVGISSDVKASQFKPTKFRAIAQKHGVFSKSIPQNIKLKQRIANVREYLRKPNFDIATDGLSQVDNALQNAGDASKFLFHIFGDIADNFFTAHWVAFNTGQGLKAAWHLHATQYNRRKLAREIATAFIDNKLSAAQLKAFSTIAAKEIEKDITPEQKEAVRDALNDLIKLRKSSHKTKRFLLLQIGYIGFQSFQAFSSAYSGDKTKAYISAYSIIAALGPLSGFAKELTRKVAKIDSKRSQKAENLAQILQINIYESLPANEP